MKRGGYIFFVGILRSIWRKTCLVSIWVICSKQQHTQLLIQFTIQKNQPLGRHEEKKKESLRRSKLPLVSFQKCCFEFVFDLGIGRRMRRSFVAGILIDCGQFFQLGIEFLDRESIVCFKKDLYNFTYIAHCA